MSHPSHKEDSEQPPLPPSQSQSRKGGGGEWRGSREEIIAYFIFFFLGVGNLFPWNAFITAASYYQSAFCQTSYENTFLSFFSTLYTFSQPVALIVNILYNRVFTIQSLVLYPLILFTIVFSITTLFVLLPDISASTLFATTLVSLFLCGFAGSVMNGGLFALTSILPPCHTASIMNGQALAGLIVSIVSLIVTASSPSDCGGDDDSNDDDGDSCSSTTSSANRYGDFAYFLVACIVLGGCIWFFLYLIHMPWIVQEMHAKLRHAIHEQQHEVLNALHSREKQEEAEERRRKKKQQKEVEDLPVLPKSSIDGEEFLDVNISSRESSIEHQHKQQQHHQQQPPPAEKEYHQRSSLSITTIAAVVDSHYEPSPSSTSTSSYHPNPSTSLSSTSYLTTLSSHNFDIHHTYEVICEIKIAAYSVFITYCGSLMVFPSVMIQITPLSSCHTSRFFGDLWLPVLYLLFNGGDFTGRVLAQHVKHWSCFDVERLHWVATIRLILPLLFLFCHIDGGNQLVTLFPTDVIPPILAWSVGISNGLLANTSMMLGPTLVDEKNAGLAGTIMNFWLTFGLLVGSMISFFCLYLVTGSAG
eukprot:gene4094-4480_t